MASVKDFERFIVPYISAPVPAIHDETMGAIIEFCQRTRVNVEWVDINLIDGSGEYTISLSGESTYQVSETLSAWTSAGKIHPATRPELDAWFPGGWKDIVASDAAGIQRYYCRLPEKIMLVPKPAFDENNGLRVEVVTTPKPTSTGVPDIVLNRYWQVIRDGALGRLHQHPASYADANRAVSYLQLFEAEIAKLTDSTSHGFSQQPLRMGRDEL